MSHRPGVYEKVPGSSARLTEKAFRVAGSDLSESTVHATAVSRQWPEVQPVHYMARKHARGKGAAELLY